MVDKKQKIKGIAKIVILLGIFMVAIVVLIKAFYSFHTIVDVIIENCKTSNSVELRNVNKYIKETSFWSIVGVIIGTVAYFIIDTAVNR